MTTWVFNKADYVKEFEEDPCLLNDTTAPHVGSMWPKLTGTAYPYSQIPCRNRVARDDRGDWCAELFDNGWVLISTYEGQSIWSPKENAGPTDPVTVFACVGADSDQVLYAGDARRVTLSVLVGDMRVEVHHAGAIHRFPLSCAGGYTGVAERVEVSSDEGADYVFTLDEVYVRADWRDKTAHELVGKLPGVKVEPPPFVTFVPEPGKTLYDAFMDQNPDATSYEIWAGARDYFRKPPGGPGEQ